LQLEYRCCGTVKMDYFLPRASCSFQLTIGSNICLELNCSWFQRNLLPWIACMLPFLNNDYLLSFCISTFFLSQIIIHDLQSHCAIFCFFCTNRLLLLFVKASYVWILAYYLQLYLSSLSQLFPLANFTLNVLLILKDLNKTNLPIIIIEIKIKLE